MTVPDMIRILCGIRNTNQSQVADKIGACRVSMNKKIRENNLKIVDVFDVADVLDYDLNIQFIDRVSKRVVEGVIKF